MNIWVAFIILVVILLAFDLGVLNRNPHKVTTREALKWTSLWVSLALAFSGFIYYAYDTNLWGIGQEVGTPLAGKEAMLLYLTGYLVEQSLSIDNVFVIAVIFTYFQIPPKYQHRVLFWGILGAVVFRGVMIGIGAFLIAKYAWIMYVFGAFLLYSAYKMATSGDEPVDPDQNPVIRLVKKIFPVTTHMDGEKFFIRRLGVVAATPLFIALMVIETTDIMFAVDSIPAIFAITTDPFIVFTSNIFAILGLRSLYFVLAAILEKFQYLKYSLVFILAFVGLKMLAIEFVHLPPWVSLVVIAIALTGGVIYSLYMDKKYGHAAVHMPEDKASQMKESDEVKA
ncbi:MAG: TerC family protein [Saprospiraceae bacterium]